jgi:cellulose synthase/poly-beta-1,6-N-acetylglucosamine synthase-like glycosyltransferase
LTDLPTFSVVVPTRARPAYLAACLEALAALDYDADRYEVVVAVDGEPDQQTAGLLRSYAGHIRLTPVSQPRSGPAATRNAGAARADGRFLAFTDDDCRPDPAWLRALAGGFESNSGAAVGGLTVNGAPDMACSIASQAVLDVTHAHHNRPGRPARFFASNNLALPTSAFREVGGFDTTFVHAEDRELCHRWTARGGTMVAAPNAVVHHLRSMRVPSFLRQHFGYGKGAYRFHQVAGTQLLPALELGFYRELAREWRRGRPGIGRWSLGALLVASQAANAAGFAAALVRDRG